MMKTPALSPAARTALTSTGTNRQGAKPTNFTKEALAELAKLGLIGDGHGLTRQGTIIRERLANDLPF